jgi:ech hydrogenase subunit A
MLALGSALTVVFWTRWAGILLSSTRAEKKGFKEEQDLLIRIPLLVLAVLAVLVSFGIPGVYSSMVLPVVRQYGAIASHVASGGFPSSQPEAFFIYPLFLIMGAGVLWACRSSRKASKRSYCPPYMSGLESGDPDKIGFVGPLRQWADFKASNYYLDPFIGEKKISHSINMISIGILIVLLAGVL